MPQASKNRDATHWLRQFGHTIEHDDGGLVRAKGDREYDKFVPVEGGFHYFRLEDGEWVQKPHHADDYLWPDAHVTHVYRAATDPSYHEQIVTDGVTWDIEAGKLTHYGSTES